MLLAIGVALAVACSAGPVLAAPSPGAQVSASQATLDKAVREYDAAWGRLSAIDTSLAANSARLDDLIAKQAELQTRLGTRASSMYRSGPLGFLEVLAGSATFDQFLTMWDALMRFSRQDAETIRELRVAKAQVSRAGKNLLEQQAEVSRRLRALDSAKARAKKDLADDQAAYASYTRRIAARETLRSASTRTPSGSSAVPRPTATTAPTGSGPWKTGVASHYGTGSYGIRLSSGVTIGPDSMIVAHKTLPFGTLVEFSYRGRYAVAKVADRGPFTRGREWDLGPGTARVLGFRGVDKVGYRIIGR